MAGDGSRQNALSSDGAWKEPLDFSPDGRSLLFLRLDEATVSTVGKMPYVAPVTSAQTLVTQTRLIVGWLAVVALSLVTLAIHMLVVRGSSIWQAVMWLVATLLLGPVALIAYWRERRDGGTVAEALCGTLFCVAGYAVGWVIAIALLLAGGEDPAPLLVLVGAVLLVFGFGWARPVPVNTNNLRQPQKDMIWVSLAGPLANLMLALFCALLLRVGAARSIVVYGFAARATLARLESPRVFPIRGPVDLAEPDPIAEAAPAEDVEAFGRSRPPVHHLLVVTAFVVLITPGSDQARVEQRDQGRARPHALLDGGLVFDSVARVNLLGTIGQLHGQHENRQRKDGKTADHEEIHVEKLLVAIQGPAPLYYVVPARESPGPQGGDYIWNVTPVGPADFIRC